MSSVYFKRKIDKELLKWRDTSNHLVLELQGSRQVGKTESLLHFSDYYENSVWINANNEFDVKVFEDAYFAANGALHDALLIYASKKKKLFTNDKRTLVVVDEIQESKLLYELIRRFNRELNCDVVVTGSYLKKAKEFFQPAGDLNIITMYPMSFSEFIDVYNALDYFNSHTIIEICDKKLDWFQKAFSIYSKVGGYPEVIKSYLTKQDFIDVQQKIVNSILTEIKYRLDTISDFTVIENCLHAILEKMLHEKKGDRRLVSSLSDLVSSYSSMRISNDECYSAISWLREAGIINYCDKQDILTGSVYNSERFYFNDLGIFSYLCYQYAIPESDVLGLLNETFIYKILAENDFSKKFYSVNPAFGVTNNYEIDFSVMSKYDNCKYGIEVKTGKNVGKSLQLALENHSIDFAVYFKGNCRYGQDKNIFTVPIALAEKFTFDKGKHVKHDDIIRLDSFSDTD